MVACLAARIRQAGREPLLIGLTATLPSTDDRDAHDNYTALLGDVDHEVPTPAVVKEGNLAPYRDHVWFVEPTQDEIAFLREHEDRLASLVATTFDDPDGADWLVHTLQPPVDQSDGDRSATASPETRLARAFDTDFAVAESAARMLAEVRPTTRSWPSSTTPPGAHPTPSSDSGCSPATPSTGSCPIPTERNSGSGSNGPSSTSASP
ncbi:hypothetical protein Q9Q99_03970 [Curtobacterium flaccumfaciens]|nr:hypothetical protein Q9Q99_03970 [Curtobacterium flaccumfaciens]